MLCTSLPEGAARLCLCHVSCSNLRVCEVVLDSRKIGERGGVVKFHKMEKRSGSFSILLRDDVSSSTIFGQRLALTTCLWVFSVQTKTGL